LKLVTFGCSWTAGVGSFYDAKVPPEQYQARKDEYDNAFRNILCKRHNFTHKNFSMGGSSNQKQFRLATSYFNKPIEEETIVLWGITTTARDEFWSCKRNKSVVVQYTTSPHPELSKLMREEYYNERYEVNLLNNLMIHWNHYFKSLGVKNYWFDTFNHHHYKDEIENLCWRNEKPRDLLSKMTGLDEDDHHFSNWSNDCVRTTKGKRLGLLNPYTFHPTKHGHEVIADMFTRHLFL
tara:strand:+ start:122 stop:832 length:711 start_codon:yes stop_codon:yes gene_type:complete